MTDEATARLDAIAIKVHEASARPSRPPWDQETHERQAHCYDVARAIIGLIESWGIALSRPAPEDHVIEAMARHIDSRLPPAIWDSMSEPDREKYRQNVRDYLAVAAACGWALVPKPAEDVTEIAHGIVGDWVNDWAGLEADGAEELVTAIAAALQARDARAKPSTDVRDAGISIATGWHDGIKQELNQGDVDDLAEWISTALQSHGDARAADAVAAERERCAKIAEESCYEFACARGERSLVVDCSRYLAAAIRRVPR